MKQKKSKTLTLWKTQKNTITQTDVWAIYVNSAGSRFLHFLLCKFKRFDWSRCGNHVTSCRPTHQCPPAHRDLPATDHDCKKMLKSAAFSHCGPHHRPLHWPWPPSTGGAAELQLVPVAPRQHVGRRCRALQRLVGTSPIGPHRVVVPQRGRLCVAHPLGVAGVMARLHQEGACAEGLQVSVGVVGLVVLTADRMDMSAVQVK